MRKAIANFGKSPSLKSQRKERKKKGMGGKTLERWILYICPEPNDPNGEQTHAHTERERYGSLGKTKRRERTGSAKVLLEIIYIYIPI